MQLRIPITNILIGMEWGYNSLVSPTPTFFIVNFSSILDSCLSEFYFSVKNAWTFTHLLLLPPQSGDCSSSNARGITNSRIATTLINVKYHHRCMKYFCESSMYVRQHQAAFGLLCYLVFICHVKHEIHMQSAAM